MPTEHQTKEQASAPKTAPTPPTEPGGAEWRVAAFRPPGNSRNRIVRRERQNIHCAQGSRQWPLQPALRPRPLCQVSSRTALCLEELRAFLEDKPEAMPVLDHVFGAAHDISGPWRLRITGFREHIVRPCCRPPGQIAFLGAVGEVRLPRNSHLLRDVAGHENGDV